MKSLRELYKIGRGPSSSHTIGPQFVAKYVLQRYGKQRYAAELFGSLALTGKGHGTDRILKRVLGEETQIVFNTEKKDLPHPNTLKIYAVHDQTGDKTQLVEAQSVGGGSVIINGERYPNSPEIYPQKNFTEIKQFVLRNDATLFEYVRRYEPDVYTHLAAVWAAMKHSVEKGLSQEGVLPGGLHLDRKAKILAEEQTKFETSIMREHRKLSAYSFAVAEQNADNGTVVTAPTCGAAGILPAVLYYMWKDHNAPEEDILNVLATAGVVGNVVKSNASISGAECGCQAEIGTACSMAAAALACMFSLDVEGIECAAEIALEHNLGLTCDPVLGLVQIPCIERNAAATIKAMNAVVLAKSLKNKRKISFDDVVAVMYKTGKDMNTCYRETSTGGLAALYTEKSDQGRAF